jgi:hypothetical protein
MNEGDENVYILVGKPEGNGRLGRPIYRWEHKYQVKS